MISKIRTTPDGLLIRPQRKNARTYVMGTVMLSNVRVESDDQGIYVLGEILHEAVEEVLPTHKVRGRMKVYDPEWGDIVAKAGYVVLGTIYVSKEIQ